jgi:hypothetical protein
MMDANWVEQIDADLLPTSEEKPKTKGQRSK